MKNCFDAKEIKRILIERLRINEQEVLDMDFSSKFIEGLTSPVRVSKVGDLINLTKCHSFTDTDSIDFEFNFRVKKSGSGIELWPIFFNSSEKGKLVAEIEMNGRRMVNTVVQTELVDIANSWGKGLTAQAFSRSLNKTI